MKLLSNYLKEMKLAARGFYFYIEIAMAVVLLLILSVFPIQHYLDPIRQKSYFYTPLRNLLPALYGLFSDRSNDLNKKFEDMFKHDESKVKKQLAGLLLNEAIDSKSVG